MTLLMFTRGQGIRHILYLQCDCRCLSSGGPCLDENSLLRNVQRQNLRTSVLTTELCLGHASTHNASGRQTTRDDVSHFVDNLRATPLLVSQSLDTIFALLSLNHLHISTHALGGEFLCKVINAQSITVEASKCAKLPAEAKLSQIKDEVLHLLFGHARAVPIERGAIIISEHLVWHSTPHFCSKLFRLAQDGLAGFHPDRIGIWSPCEGSLDAEF